MSKIQDRKVQVLKFIVEEYLKTGEIMGSKNLLSKYDLQVSSATVRNDMASLEDMGLIFQPYNSAGRLPTNRIRRLPDADDAISIYRGRTRAQSKNRKKSY